MDFNVDKNSQIVYVVTADGYGGQYGAEIYLLGVFNNRADADVCATQRGIGADITEVELNKSYPLKPEAWGDNKNENYLGGYCE